MASKMLIDATHREETRVVVSTGKRVEEFDLESQERRQLRGNIYLAKVTRVEPSLQAAFVDYGGNRHGFLAFGEIHPDYYQIPFSDRQALLKEVAAAEAAANEADFKAGDAAAEAEARSTPHDDHEDESAHDDLGHDEHEDDEHGHDGHEDHGHEDHGHEDHGHEDHGHEDHDHEHGDEDRAADDRHGGEAAMAGGAEMESASAESSEAEHADTGEDAAEAEDGAPSQRPAESDGGRRPRRRRRRGAAHEARMPSVRGDGDENGGAQAEDVENVGAEDALEEVPDRYDSRRRQYKIQEVIRRRQILLVQVVKEERGTKGAALTTYLSLAGRYCVLMPNTARGGGISRKITSLTDRKRLKSIAGDLDVPEGTGVIVRTAGANRTKAEIKRDYEYLQRLWESIRALTLKSTAPSLIYEEGSLIKRSIRDLYNKDVEEILVEGDDGYREAKAFMRMLMPSHARHVKQYKEPQPLFAHHRIESQLDQMFSPVVTLKSGGYLVINQTEALVAIDVNSGKSTREHNIEDTALQTNLEAASEVARQLRLRDLAGLIVIDFIDMEENRNNRAVERRIKESLKTDRARIQVGRISHFGLLEMSRQRIRASVTEGTMELCGHCEGLGRVRSVSSAALQIVRALEEAAMDGGRRNLTVRASADIVLYMLNHKRPNVAEIEQRYGIRISVAVDESLLGARYAIDRGAVSDMPIVRPSGGAVQIDTVFEEAESEEDPVEETVEDEEEEDEEQVDEVRQDARSTADADEAGSSRRRRRRRGRRRPDDGGAAEPAEREDGEERGEAEAGEQSGEPAGEDGENGQGRQKRRRGRRGGRRQRRDGERPANGEPAELHANGSGQELPPAPQAGEPEPGAPATASFEPPADFVESTTTPDAATEPAPAPSGSGLGRLQRAIAWPWQRAASSSHDAPAAEAAPAAQAEPVTQEAEPEPRAAEPVPEPVEVKAAMAEEATIREMPAPPPELESEEPSGPQRRGWWQRRAGADS